jgi:CubicO group peptidase (beta-lactamase class C family)
MGKRTRQSSTLFKELCQQIEQAMQRFLVPGVAVGVIDGDQEYTAGFGVTSIDNPLPITDETLFQIGSTTKTVTGTLALRLVKEGKLDLDKPVRTYLPDLRLMDEDVAARVTMRHLLTHTGGWVGDYFDDFGAGDDALDKIVRNMAGLPQLTPLGEIWHYNNAGFYLAGRVIESILGRPYEMAAKEMVLDSLGMKMSFFFAHEVITYRVAIGHNNPDEDGKWATRVARPWAMPRTASPAGGIISTVKDQLRYARFHMGDGTAEDGTRILSPESIALMQTPQVDAADGNRFGITWFLRDMDDTQVVRHGGATNGQMSAFYMVPSRRFAITILNNADLGRSLNRDIIDWALRNYLGLKEPEHPPLESSKEELAPYAGLYTYLTNDLELYIGDGTLWLRDIPKLGLPGQELSPPDPPMRAALYDEDRLVILDEPMKDSHIEFLRGSDGSIKWMRVSGRVLTRDRADEERRAIDDGS